MIEIRVGESETRLWSEMTPGELREAIGRRRNDDEMGPVVVDINDDCIDLLFQIPPPTGPGGGRNYHRREEKVLELWQQYDLRSQDFPVGQLIAFLKRLEHDFDC